MFKLLNKLNIFSLTLIVKIQHFKSRSEKNKQNWEKLRFIKRVNHIKQITSFGRLRPDLSILGLIRQLQSKKLQLLISKEFMMF